MAIKPSNHAQDVASWVIKINQQTQNRNLKQRFGGGWAQNLYQEEEFKLAVFYINRLLRYSVSPEQAAQEYASNVEPLILANEKGGMTSILDVILDAVHTFGQDPDLSLRLNDFLDALSCIEITDNEGNPRYAGYGCGRLWTDLRQSWGIEFREGAFDIQDIDNLGFPPYITPDEWLTQRPKLLGASTFAAICTAKREASMYDKYCLWCLDWIADPEFDYPEDESYEFAMWVPTFAVWMHLAAQQIYEACAERKETSFGPYSLELWEKCRQGFEQIAASEGVREETREEARKAVVDMGIAESDWAAAHRGTAERG